MAETICRAIVKGRLFSAVETRNMFDWHSTDDGTASAFAAAVGAKITAMFNCVNDSIAGSAWHGYALEAEHWDGESWVPDYATSFTISPNGVGSTPQYQTAVLLTMTTTHPKTVGRKFIAGFLDALCLDGGLAVSALTQFATFILQWLSPITDGDAHLWYPGVMDKTHVFRAFNGGSVGQVLSTWRKRKPGYGI